MTALKAYNASGLSTPAAPFCYDASGNKKLAKVVSAYNSLGNRVTVAQECAAPTVTPATSNVFHNTAVTLTASAPVGGYGNISYLWTRISGVGTITSATSLSCSVNSTLGGTGTFAVTFTDTVGGKVIDTIAGANGATVTWA